MDIAKVIVENVAYLIGMIMAGIIVVLMEKGRQYLKKKWDINLADEQFDTMTHLAKKGINYAEERALQWAKEGERGSSAQKLDAAMEFINDQVVALGLDKMARDALVKLIESELQVKRNGG